MFLLLLLKKNWSWCFFSFTYLQIVPCIHSLTVRFTRSRIWASALSLKLSCATLIIPVVLQAPGQITVLMDQLTQLQVRHTLSGYCNSKPGRSIQNSNWENSTSVMFSVEFSCCVCSCLQNWRSKGSSLEQKPFFFILCLLVCLFFAPLAEPFPWCSGIPEPHARGRWMPRKLWSGWCSMDRHVPRTVLATAGSNGSAKAVPRCPLCRLREGKSKCEFIRSLEITSVLSPQMLTMLILLPVWEYM